METTKEVALQRLKQLLEHKKEMERRADEMFKLKFPEDFVTA